MQTSSITLVSSCSLPGGWINDNCFHSSFSTTCKRARHPHNISRCNGWGGTARTPLTVSASGIWLDGTDHLFLYVLTGTSSNPATVAMLVILIYICCVKLLGRPFEKGPCCVSHSVTEVKYLPKAVTAHKQHMVNLSFDWAIASISSLVHSGVNAKQPFRGRAPLLMLTPILLIMKKKKAKYKTYWK